MKLKFPKGLPKEQCIREEAELIQTVWMCLNLFDNNVMGNTLLLENEDVARFANGISTAFYNLYNELVFADTDD
jgi:hypothetical protein